MTPNIIEEVLPDELPIPCKCVKCAKSNVCTCHINKIRYCICETKICSKFEEGFNDNELS